MATVATQSKIAASIKVVTGTTETGAQKLSSQSLGSLDPTGTLDANKDKIFTIADAIAACMSNLVARLEVTTTSLLSDNS